MTEKSRAEDRRELRMGPRTIVTCARKSSTLPPKDVGPDHGGLKGPPVRPSSANRLAQAIVPSTTISTTKDKEGLMKLTFGCESQVVDGWITVDDPLGARSTSS